MMISRKKRLIIHAATFTMLGFGLGVGATAVAHADPNTYFLECLNAKGIDVLNIGGTLDIGMRIQNDQKEGTPVSTTLYNLEHYFGVPPDIAYADVACALDTLMS